MSLARPDDAGIPDCVAELKVALVRVRQAARLGRSDFIQVGLQRAREAVVAVLAGNHIDFLSRDDFRDCCRFGIALTKPIDQPAPPSLQKSEEAHDDGLEDNQMSSELVA